MKQRQNGDTHKMSDEKRASKNTVKIGSYTVFISILAIVVVIALNLVVSKLPSQYTKYDTSSQKLYTISPQTQEVLDGLEEEVILYYIAPQGKYDLPTQEMLKRYESLSPLVRVEYVDPLLYPNFATQYTNEELYGNDIIVKIGDKSQLVGYADIYDIVYNVSYANPEITYDTVFQGESSLTNAISYLTKGELPIVYNVIGHGEVEIPPDLIRFIERQNMMVKDLNIYSESIPDDANCLLIISPRNDISETELEILLKYLGGGGNILLLTDYIDKELKNLDSLANHFGLGRLDGLIIDPTQGYSMSGYPMYLATDVLEHEITMPLIRSRYGVLMPVCHGIVPLPAYRDSLNIIPILATSGNAYLKPDAISSEILTLTREEGDISGPFVVGAVSTDTYGDVNSKFVWISTSEFLKDNYDSISAGGNRDLFVNAIAFMCEHEDAITIHAKTISTKYLNINSSQATALTLIFVGIIPLSVLLIGLIVWYRRKKS